MPPVCSSRASQFFHRIPNVYKTTLNICLSLRFWHSALLFPLDYMILKVHVAIFSMNKAVEGDAIGVVAQETSLGYLVSFEVSLGYIVRSSAASVTLPQRKRRWREH